MKICLPFFIFGKYGGVRVVSNILNIWAEAGNEIEILSVGDVKPYFPISEKIKVSYYNNKFQVFKHLYREFNNYDKILGVYVISTYLIFLASLLRGSFKKNYYYIQAYEADSDFANSNALWLSLVKLSYKLPFHRIVNADIYKNYKWLHADDIVYPGLDLNLYYSKDVNFFNDTIRVGCIGRIEKWKGTQDVCTAIEILKKQGYNIDFYIAFNDFETVEHHFVKPDGDDKLSSFYRDMDIIAAPGHIQLGAVHYPVIESMAVGTSVITTGYLPADNTNSYIVPVKSPEKIAEAIVNVLNNRDGAIVKRKKAIKDVQQFSWGNIANKFMLILKEK